MKAIFVDIIGQEFLFFPSLRLSHVLLSTLRHCLEMVENVNISLLRKPYYKVKSVTAVTILAATYNCAELQ